MLYCFSAWLIFLRRRWCPFEKDSSWWVAETRYMFNCLIIIHYLLFRCRLKFSFCVDFELFKVSHLRQPYRYCNLAYRLISLWGLFEILCEIFFFFSARHALQYKARFHACTPPCAPKPSWILLLLFLSIDSLLSWVNSIRCIKNTWHVSHVSLCYIIS